MLQIDFVSDVSCPWCAIGLHALEAAAARVAPEVAVQIRFQPFELNPQMAPEGEDVTEHLARKYRITPEQIATNTEAIRQRGAEVGFTFTMGARRRIYNTRSAHRLLHWAGLLDEAGGGDRQRQLKHALLAAYFTDGLDPSDPAVLLARAEACGLARADAAEVLASGRYDDEVAAAERQWHENGISSVPSIIVNQKYLIQGGQPVERFERALRQIASEAVA